MRKEDFIKSVFSEEEAVVTRLFDKLVIAEKSGKIVHSNEFYTPGIWSGVLKLNSQLETNVFCDGVFEEAERRMITFCIEEHVYQPIKVLCINNKSKFHSLQHKDYLGAIMSLGIKREKIGDLIVAGDRCYCAVCEDIASYICDNIDMVAHCPCEVTEIYDYEKMPTYRFEEKIVISTSMRADCIISSLTGLSRSKSVDLIRAGKVLIDYVEVREKDYDIDTASTVTVRGYGKFKICEVVGNSGSGRLKVLVKKFI